MSSIWTIQNIEHFFGWQHDVETSSFGTRSQYAPSISDSLSSLYSQNTLGTSTLIDENESFYVPGHERDINNAKLAALSAALEKAQTQLAHEMTAREEAESVIGALRGEVGLLSGKLERADAELAAARQREREVCQTLEFIYDYPNFTIFFCAWLMGALTLSSISSC
jgi:hypothetical protein